MATHAAPTTADDTAPVPDLSTMNNLSMNGWKFFTNFLLWNVVATVVVLLLLGLFTVWS